MTEFNEKIKANADELDDEILDQVSGGTSKWRPNVKTLITESTTDTNINNTSE